MSDRDDELLDLIGTHRRQLFGFIFGIVHNLEDAEDVFQQTSIVLWEKFDQFAKGTDFVAWACSIARFKAINMTLSKRREKALFSDVLMDEMVERQHSQSALFEARADALEACRNNLSDRDQLVLGACYATDATIKEVAEQFGRPPGSVRNSLHRIRGLLAKCIEKRLAQEVES